jgi:hypothetical protein
VDLSGSTFQSYLKIMFQVYCRHILIAPFTPAQKSTEIHQNLLCKEVLREFALILGEHEHLVFQSATLWAKILPRIIIVLIFRFKCRAGEQQQACQQCKG